MEFTNFVQNRQKLYWHLSAGMACLLHLLKVRRSAENTYKYMNLVMPTVVLAVAFVIVHVGSEKSCCVAVLPFVYLFSILTC